MQLFIKSKANIIRQDGIIIRPAIAAPISIIIDTIMHDR